MSKVIRDCIGFALLCPVSGLENSRHLLNQSDTKLKPIATWLLAFSRALGWLHAFTSISHWLPLIFSFLLICRCDHFGFGFTTLNRKALYKLSKQVLDIVIGTLYVSGILLFLERIIGQLFYLVLTFSITTSPVIIASRASRSQLHA